MVVAVCQFDMVWEDRQASLAKAEKFIIQAAKKKCDCIIFPEMSFTGFSMNIDKIGEFAHDSYTEKYIRNLAINNNIAIGYGWTLKEPEKNKKGKNMFSFLDKKGKKIAEYTKIHPFSNGDESLYYDKGNKIVNFSYLGRNLSQFICYDLRFPEIFQIASKRADIIIVIANWPKSRKDHWEKLLQARAIENQSYIVGVNCVGKRDGIVYSGNSMVVDCYGNILDEISEKEGLLICEIKDEAGKLREDFKVKEDRRESLYTEFFNNK